MRGIKQKTGQKILVWGLLLTLFTGTGRAPGISIVSAAAQTKTITIGFEDGNGGFTGRGAASVMLTKENAYSGSCMSVSGGTESWNGAEKDLTGLASGNAVLTVSAYVRNNEEYEITSHMTLQEEKKNGTTDYSWIRGDVVIAPGEWKRMSGTIVVNPETVKPVLYFETKEVGVSFSIDQIQIIIETEETVNDPEFDVNYTRGQIIDFEDGQVYFDKIGDPKLSITQDGGYKGSKGLLVSGRSESYEGPLKEVPEFMEEGTPLAETSVSAAALVKNCAEEKRQIAITLRLTRADGTQEYQTLAQAVAEAGSWVQLITQSAYTIGEGITEAAVYIEAQGTDSFIVDCVNLVAEKSEQNAPHTSVAPFENIKIDFENGDPWFTDRGDAKGTIVTDAKGGERALAVTGRTENWHGVEKDLAGAALAGKGLQISFWVKNTSSYTVENYLTLQETDEAGNVTYTRIAGGEVHPGKWIRLSGGANVQLSTVQPVIYFEASDPVSAFVIDDVTMQVTSWMEELKDARSDGVDIEAAGTRTSVQPFSSLLIDFEGGDPFFDSRGDGKGVLTAHAHGGNRALSVKGRTLSWHGVERDFTDANLQGKVLQVSFWTKHGQSEAQDIRFCIQEESADGEIAYNWIAAGMGIASGEWTEITGEYLVDKAAEKVILYFEATDPYAPFLIDDVELKVVDALAVLESDKEKEPTEGEWIKNTGKIYMEATTEPWKMLISVLAVCMAAVGAVFFQRKKEKRVFELE